MLHSLLLVFWINVRGVTTVFYRQQDVVSPYAMYPVEYIFSSFILFYPSWPLKTGPDMSKKCWN